MKELAAKLDVETIDIDDVEISNEIDVNSKRNL